MRSSLCKDEVDNGSPTNPIMTSSSFEGKALRFRSPSTSQDQHNHFGQSENHESTPSPSPSRDMLLQWGQKKRSRVSRTLTDESSSSAQATQRRLLHARPSHKLPPPPPPPPPSSSNASPRKEASGSLHRYPINRSHLPFHSFLFKSKINQSQFVLILLLGFNMLRHSFHCCFFGKERFKLWGFYPMLCYAFLLDPT